MTHIEQLEKLLNVKITEDLSGTPDLSIHTMSTADGYEVYVITNNEKQLYWEDEVYYYEPSFEDIIDRIKDTSWDPDDEPITVYCSDIEQFFNEYEVEDYIEQNKDNEDDN